MQLVTKPRCLTVEREQGCRYACVCSVSLRTRTDAAGEISSVPHKAAPTKTRIFLFVWRKGVEKTEGDIQISRPVNLNCYLPRCCPLVTSYRLCADALTLRYRGGVSSPELNKIHRQAVWAEGRLVWTVRAWIPGQGSIKVSQIWCVCSLAICGRKKGKTTEATSQRERRNDSVLICLWCVLSDGRQCRVSVVMNPNFFAAVLPTVRKTTTMWMWRLHVSIFSILLLAFSFSCRTKRTDQGKDIVLL
jgi:hypothetical protein